MSCCEGTRGRRWKHCSRRDQLARPGASQSVCGFPTVSLCLCLCVSMCYVYVGNWHAQFNPGKASKGDSATDRERWFAAALTQVSHSFSLSLSLSLSLSFALSFSLSLCVCVCTRVCVCVCVFLSLPDLYCNRLPLSRGSARLRFPRRSAVA